MLTDNTTPHASMAIGDTALQPTSLLDDMVTILASKGIGTLGTDFFIGWQPPSIDNCVTLYSTGGNPLDLAAPLDYPSFQVRTRNTDYGQGEFMAKAVSDALHGVCEVDVGTNHYLLISAKQSPTSLGMDANNRDEWTQNFDVIMRRT